MEQKFVDEKIIAITNIKIFDGKNVIDHNMITIKGSKIYSVGGEIPKGAEVIDGKGATLMPGLIDSHVYTDMGGLRDALKFGITTELEMNGRWSAKQRKEISERNDIADMRSPGMGVTPKGGHPSEYISSSPNLLFRILCRLPFIMPSADTPKEAVKLVNKQIANGADYIKIFLEDGSCVGFPGLPVLNDETLKASIDEAHRNNKLTIVHALTAESAKRAVKAGIDCLGHLFFDCMPSPKFINEIAETDTFIIPTLVTLSTAFGNNAASFANDERVKNKLSKVWLDSLSRSMNVYPQGSLEDAFASIRALKEAGVDILAGSDVSEPMPILGGLAHGVSLHHELQLLVEAGLSPAETLQAATSVPARRFGLSDRGNIKAGMIADLLLVDGDPLLNISDTLSVKAVWNRGEELDF